MKVIEKAYTPNGIEIQLEDWTDKYTNRYMIGAYPIAKRSGKWGWIREGESFRLNITTNEYLGYIEKFLFHDFECLKSGEKKLEDLQEYYSLGCKDKWYMGLSDINPEQ